MTSLDTWTSRTAALSQTQGPPAGGCRSSTGGTWTGLPGEPRWVQAQRDFTLMKKDIPSTAQQQSQPVYLPVLGHSDLVMILPYLA